MDYKALQIFLVDCSSTNFTEDVFPNVPMKRAKLFSGLVASAIFDMEILFRKEDVIISIILFDSRINTFIDLISIKQIFDKYENAQDLEQDLFESMSLMGDKRNIGKTLDYTFQIVDSFLKCNIEKLGNYEVFYYPIFNPLSGEDKVIPNLRIILLTGKSIDIQDDNLCYNYGENFIIENFLTTVYFANDCDNFFNQLSDISGNCFLHNNKNSILVSQASYMRSLIRFMRLKLNSPNYFCKECLNQINY